MGVALDQEGSILSTLFGVLEYLESKELFNTAENIYFVLDEPEKIFERIFVRPSVVRSWPKWKLIFRA